jgi:uncharacterized protein (DUF433 family)
MAKEVKTMSGNPLLSRINCDPRILSGKPVIQGTRLSVEFVLNLLAHGATAEQIVEEYEGLSHDDILACLLFASRSLSSAACMPLAVESA